MPVSLSPVSFCLLVLCLLVSYLHIFIELSGTRYSGHELHLLLHCTSYFNKSLSPSLSLILYFKDFLEMLKAYHLVPCAYWSQYLHWHKLARKKLRGWQFFKKGFIPKRGVISLCPRYAKNWKSETKKKDENLGNLKNKLSETKQQILWTEIWLEKTCCQQMLKQKMSQFLKSNWKSRLENCSFLYTEQIWELEIC